MASKPRRWTLDPKVDLVFSLLFGAEQNRRLLIALLTDVLRPSAPLVSVELLPPRPDVTEVDEKLVFLDLRVRLENGEQIDVEMQTRRHAALRSRVLFYWGRMYTGQLQRGQPYSGLQRCAVILITDFVELLDTGFHSVFQVRERASGQLFSDQLELHLLELPKLRDAWAEQSEPELAAWCKFFSAETDEQLEALAMQHPILKEAKDALDELSADPEARERAARRDIELKLHEYGARLLLAEGRQQGLAEGRQEGLAEGRQEGLAEGALQTSRSTLSRLLKLKFGEPPSGVQARIAAASETELEHWLERLLSADTLDAIFH